MAAPVTDDRASSSASEDATTVVPAPPLVDQQAMSTDASECRIGPVRATTVRTSEPGGGAERAANQLDEPVR